MKFLTYIVVRACPRILISRPINTSTFGTALTSKLSARQMERLFFENALKSKDAIIEAKDGIIQEKESRIQSIIEAKESRIQSIIEAKDGIIQEKESRIQSIIEAKDGIIQEKERRFHSIIEAKDSIIEEKESRIQEKESRIQEKESTRKNELKSKEMVIESKKLEVSRLQASYDFVKKTLDARHIIETYEAGLKKTGSRREKWEKHLKSNPTIDRELRKSEDTDWAPKVERIYANLSFDIHQQTIDAGNDKYLLRITKGLSKSTSWFINVIAKEVYGPYVRIEEV